MLSKLISYVLGCAFVFIFTQNLRASHQEDESKPKQTGRKIKVGNVADGYKAPHASLAVTDVAEFQQKLQALVEEQEKPKASSSQGKKSNVKKTSGAPNNATPSNVKTSKKTRAKQELLSRVPITIDVPLEEVSSAPTTILTSTTEIHPVLPPVSPVILPYDSAPNILTRREITTTEVAGLMPFAPNKAEKAASSSSSPKQKTTEKEKTTKKKASKKSKGSEQSPQASPSKSDHIIGKNYTPQQIWTMLSDRPQILEESAEAKARAKIAPKELYPIHILLALAAGTQQKMVKDHITGTDQLVTRYNKVYIPEIKMYVEYLFMEEGILDTLKDKLLFETYSQDKDMQDILHLLRISGKDDFAKIAITEFMQKAELGIQSLTQKHYAESRIHVERTDSEKRLAGNTFGKDYNSNYVTYELVVYKGKGKDKIREPIKGLQIRLIFSALK